MNTCITKWYLQHGKLYGGNVNWLKNALNFCNLYCWSHRIVQIVWLLHPRGVLYPGLQVRLCTIEKRREERRRQHEKLKKSKYNPKKVCEERTEWKCKNKKKKFSIMESIRIFLSSAYHSKKSKDKKSNTNRQSKKMVWKKGWCDEFRNTAWVSVWKKWVCENDAELL